MAGKWPVATKAWRGASAGTVISVKPSAASLCWPRHQSLLEQASRPFRQ
jgi:hypothetical protein